MKILPLFFMYIIDSTVLFTAKEKLRSAYFIGSKKKRLGGWSAGFAISSFCIFTNFLLSAVGEIHLDGTKNLKRHSENGSVAFVNFAAHKFRHLNITPLLSASVKNIKECGKLCVDHPSCFSTNVAAFFHEEGLILCELLPSDKYNNSDKFLDSAMFHHFSIKVREKRYLSKKQKQKQTNKQNTRTRSKLL